MKMISEENRCQCTQKKKITDKFSFTAKQLISLVSNFNMLHYAI